MSPREKSFPRGMVIAGRMVHRLLSLGLPMGPLRLLRTRGRHTGTYHEVPIALLRAGGEQWLVSPFGSVAWVRNVRANREAYLRRGGDIRRVHLVAVDDAEVSELLRAYRRRFAAVPFVRAAFAATGREPLDAFVREAHLHPVFRVGEVIDPPGRITYNSETMSRDSRPGVAPCRSPAGDDWSIAARRRQQTSI